MARYDDFSFNQGLSAEAIAEKWGMSRTQLDEFAVRSHENAPRAVDSGAFERQIVPIETPSSTVTVDEGIRRETSVETLAKLKPSFKEGGLIHAGNSSQISDGAAALLVTTEERARELGLTPLVRYHSGAGVGEDSLLMLTGPIPLRTDYLPDPASPYATSGCTRSTRPSPLYLLLGSPRRAPIRTSSTPSAAPSPSATRSGPRVPD